MNSRLYSRNKSVHKSKEIKAPESIIVKEEEEEIECHNNAPIKSVSEKHFGFDFASSFEKTKPSKEERNRKLKLLKAEKMIEREK